jgi:lysophospholipase L1-like esterase
MPSSGYACRSGWNDMPFATWMLVGLLVALSAPVARGQYQNDINRWTTQDALDPPPAGAVLFVGSSSIRRWEQLALDFNDYRIIQRGFGGATFDNVNTYVNDIVLPYQPRAIVVWAGTNDIASGSDGNEVFADYQQFVGAVHASQPDVDIFYLGIMPTPGRFDNGPEETVANTAIANQAAADARLHYVDLPAAFNALNPPFDPAFTGLFVDDIHLNRQGYELWTSIIRPAVEAVIAPDKTPPVSPGTFSAGSRLLFDFGPSNPFDGDPTANPDTNGFYWNNWHPADGEIPINAGEHLGGLIDDAGSATGMRLTITGGFSSNGKVNGGLLNPDSALLGDIAIATATQDYFFCSADNLVGGGNDDIPGGFMLDGLDPAFAYTLRFFGSRRNTQTRVTEYRVTGANSGMATLQTTGFNIGADGAYDGNDDTFGVVGGIRPDAFGQIFVDLTLLQGPFAYINALELTAQQPGDWDADGDVDAGDALGFIACLAGPGQTPFSPDCLSVFDADFDDDIDLGDFAGFARLAGTF